MARATIQERAEVTAGTKWTWAWLAWAGAFAVIEGVALMNKKEGDTLSEHLRLWFSTMSNDGGLGCHLKKVVPLAFVIWLVGHLYKGW